MARTKTVEIDGERFVLAPLTIDQVEEHLSKDNLPGDTDVTGWRDRSVLAVSQSLGNARRNDPTAVLSVSDEFSPSALKSRLYLSMLNDLYVAVLEVSGLRVEAKADSQGEAPTVTTAATAP